MFHLRINFLICFQSNSDVFHRRSFKIQCTILLIYFVSTDNKIYPNSIKKYSLVGQVLVNWLVSSFSAEERRRDARLLLPQICTDLLTAGVIKQIRDKDAVYGELFRVSLRFLPFIVCPSQNNNSGAC